MQSIVSINNKDNTIIGRSLPWQRQVLQLSNGYRLFLSLVLWLVYSLGIGGFASSSPSFVAIDYFTLVVISYYCFGVMAMVVSLYRWLPFGYQAPLTALIDILFLTALIYVSGGVNSGWGILFNISIIGSAVLLPVRQIMLVAAVAALGVIFQELLIALEHSFVAAYLLNAGVLGGSFFVTAYLASTLLTRLQQSESLLNQKSTDLAQLEQLNQRILQRLCCGIIAINKDSEIVVINQATRLLLGIPQHQQVTTIQDLSPALKDYIDDIQSSRQRMGVSQSIKLMEQEMIVEAIPLENELEDGLLLFIEDPVRTLQQVQQMKLASLGRFTASIVHELRNPLGAAAHAAQLLAETRTLPREEIRLIQIISDQVERVNIVIKNILQLSRREKSIAQVVDLESWIENFIDQFKSSQPDNITIDFDLRDPKLQVHVDANQLYQVMSNLCENGLRYGGQGNAPHDLKLMLHRDESTDLPVLDIYDRGKGISEQGQARLFEPFYTTSQSGTGLGLYIAKELCEANQARLDYMPMNPDQKGHFRISFLEVKHYD